MRKDGLFAPLFLSGLIAGASISSTEAQDRWRKADAAVVRLSPSVFHQLPRRVTQKLLALGCTVPQASELSTRHNVIKGNFERPGQTDWAVLCSRLRISSILIFWGGSAKSISQIAKAPDEAFLQTIDANEKIGFSRRIMRANKDYILEHYRNYHGPKPPPIHHQGIDDAFLEKASTIHYYFRGRWRELQGAD
jgi:hypothetical protein